MRAVLLLALPTALAVAAEQGVRLRLGLQAMPTDFYVGESGYAPLSYGYDDGASWDSAGRLGLDAQWTPHEGRVVGFGLGFGVGMTRYRDDGDRALVLEQYGCWIEPTLLIAPTGWLNLELAGHIGGGVAEFDSAGGYRYDRGSYFEMGITSRIVAVIAQRYEAILAGGHIFGDCEADWSNDSGTDGWYASRSGDTYIEVDGVWFGVGAGIRL